MQVLVKAMPFVLAQYPRPRRSSPAGGRSSKRCALWPGVWTSGRKCCLPAFISDDDRDRLFKVADCAVFPSLYEPFGIVALEAMAAHCPVVVSEVGGLKEVVQHAETGITVYPDDPASLAWGIAHTLQHPDWAAARVANAYRVVRDEYNWERIARLTAAVYERIVAERAGSLVGSAEGRRAQDLGRATRGSCSSPGATTIWWVTAEARRAGGSTDRPQQALLRLGQLGLVVGMEGQQGLAPSTRSPTLARGRHRPHGRWAHPWRAAPAQ